MSNNVESRAIWPVRVWRFYRDGFRQMTVGRYLWALIIVKLFFIFAVMKLFFFPDLLSRDYSTDAERSEAVRKSMLAPERTSPSAPVSPSRNTVSTDPVSRTAPDAVSRASVDSLPR